MKRKILFTALVLIVIVIGLLHFFTPGHLILYHDTYRRLSYFPIVIGAIWFGPWGGFVLAVLSSIAFIPHLLLFIGQRPETYISELTEVILYLAAGIVTGLIAGRLASLKEKYRLLSEKLERSYARLHEDTALLLELEEQLSASQKLSVLGEMSASLAHEIKNPLSSIKGTAEIFLDEFPQGHPKREFVEILIKEVSRLNGTVETVLNYSRGNMTEGGEVDETLRDVVGQVTKLVQSHKKKKGVSVDIKGLENCGDVLVPGRQLVQVVLNVMLNAIDAVPVGGRVWMDIAKDDHGITLAVSDDGPGILEDDREKVFEPFYSGKEGGTGLGLAISKKIMERYGGRITVSESSLGGAKFTMILPQLS